jgi:hypothetical protein
VDVGVANNGRAIKVVTAPTAATSQHGSCGWTHCVAWFKESRHGVEQSPEFLAM